MSKTVQPIRAVDLAKKVGVDAKRYREKLRAAADRGYIRHFVYEPWTFRAGSEEHGVLLAVLRQLVGYYGAERLRQLEQEYMEMRAPRPPDLPSL